MAIAVKQPLSSAGPMMFLKSHLISRDSMINLYDPDGTAVNTQLILGNVGGQTITFFYSAAGVATLKIISSSADDDGSPAGTGAQTVSVVYIDNYDIMKVETVTMNGTTAVALTGTYRMILFAYIAAAGAGATAAGNITITNAAGDVYYLAINASTTQSNYAYLYVPPNCVGAVMGSCYFIKATTDTDTVNLIISKMDATATWWNTYFLKNWGGGIVKTNACTMDFDVPLLPGIYKIEGLKVGSTSQTLFYSIQWGYRYA